MKNSLNLTPVLDDILNNRKGYTLLYRAIRGSHAYGLATEKSDIDEVWVYITKSDDILGLGEDYKPIIENESHDIVCYEIGRFLELCQKSNPTTLEALHIPDDCIIYKHKKFDRLISLKSCCISKAAFKPFVGYSREQIKKARGLRKMIAMDPVEKRLSVLDFFYVPYKEGSTKIINWFAYRNLNQRYASAINVPNRYMTLNVYYDFKQQFNNENVTSDDLVNSYLNPPELSTTDIITALKKEDISEQEKEKYNLLLKESQFYNMVEFIMDFYRLDRNNPEQSLKDWYDSLKVLGYRGLVKSEEDGTESNEIRVSSIEKGQTHIVSGTYNKDSYSSHCRDYYNYQTWLRNRNEERFLLNAATKSYDTKNMMHSARLMSLGKRLAVDGTFNLRVEDDEREFLLSIKYGKPKYEEIIEYAEKLNDEMIKAMETSDLPDNVDSSILESYLLDIRKWKLKEEKYLSKWKKTNIKNVLIKFRHYIKNVVNIRS